jgi:CelD/BcsL family acetyltransferase involved in cellulose biosynthesis
LANADGQADVLSLAAVPRTSPWPRLLREGWPGVAPRFSLVRTIRAPYVEVADSGYDAWLGSRSRNFRQQVRARKREFVRHGGQFRLASSRDEVAIALTEFERLHRNRWEPRGGSQALSAPVAAMLQRVGSHLDPARLQVWTAEVDGVAVGAALFVAAGTEMHYWLGGFDEAWARCSPSLLLLVEAVRHAADTGHRKVSLGPGPQHYKYRLATGEDLLDWIDILPRNGRYPYVRLCQSPYRLRRVLSNRTPPRIKRRLRSSAERLRGGTRGTNRQPPRQADAGEELTTEARQHA